MDYRISIYQSYIMEQYLCPDIVINILRFLDKDTSFHFLNIAKFMEPNKHLLYEKYKFNGIHIENNNIKQHIKNLGYYNYIYPIKQIDIELYTNLRYLSVWQNNLGNSLDILSEHLHTLQIVDNYYNQPQINLPSTLKILSIQSHAFDQPLENLPDLEKLVIFNQ